MLRSGVHTNLLYGVRKPRALTSSGFEPAEHLPPDIMYDILEVVISFIMRHVISYLISHSFFTLSALNLHICNYNYALCESKNKPELSNDFFFKGKSNIRSSALQVLYSFRHFSLFVGECVPSGNEVWRLHLLPREVVDIIMCRRIPVTHVPYFQRLIHFLS